MRLSFLIYINFLTIRGSVVLYSLYIYLYIHVGVYCYNFYVLSLVLSFSSPKTDKTNDARVIAITKHEAALKRGKPFFTPIIMMHQGPAANCS